MQRKFIFNIGNVGSFVINNFGNLWYKLNQNPIEGSWVLLSFQHGVFPYQKDLIYVHVVMATHQWHIHSKPLH